MYSIIIPVYNRNPELECCLVCLLQQDFNVFEVIIADDGSEQNTWSLVKKFSYSGTRSKREEGLNIKYFWQPHAGFRAGQARNKGVSIMDKNSDTAIFLDSDIIVKPNWLSEFDKLHRKYPFCVICARYDFLLPMMVVPQLVVRRFDEVVSNRLPILHSPVGEWIGADMRVGLFERGEEPHGDSPGCLFGGNTLIPKKIFLEVGGFDENMAEHGGEDTELGFRLGDLGCKFVFTEKPMGWHLYHKRNQAKNIESLKRNVEYIDKKHHRGKYQKSNGDKD